MMRSSLLSLALFLGAFTFAHAQGGDDDGAECLALEQRREWMRLSHSFWSAGSNFTEADFEDAHLPFWAFDEVQHIIEHEGVHVEALGDLITSTCGDSSNATSCGDFIFPESSMTNLTEWLMMGRYFEIIGAAGWIGAVSEFQSPLEQMLAASMAAEQSGHSGFLSTILNATATANPFVQPLDSQSVGSIALQYIDGEECELFEDAYTALPQDRVSLEGNTTVAIRARRRQRRAATHCAFAYDFTIVMTAFDGENCALPSDVIPPAQAYVYLVSNETRSGGDDDDDDDDNGGNDTQAHEDDAIGDGGDISANNTIRVISGPALLELGVFFEEEAAGGGDDGGEDDNE